MALEQPGIPMHVAALVLLEGSPPLTLDDVQRLVSTKLRGRRRFHDTVRWPFGGQRPVWDSARRVNTAHHFFRHVLPPAAHESALLKLCAEIHREPLRRDRPLWQVHLIDGLPGDRQAILVKTHHALGDGLSGIEIGELFFEPEPGQARPAVPVTRFVTEARTLTRKALDAIVGLLVTAAGGPLAGDGPFNGAVGAERSFATATLSMRDVRSLKRRLGVTVDDVLTAVVASGISRYLHEVGYSRIPTVLRAMVPVSMRPAQRVASPNQVSAIFLDLPVETTDLATALDAIVDQKDALRRAHAAVGGSLLVDAAAMLPTPLHALALRAVSGLRFANLVLSDIPGPPQRLFLLGHRVVACYPLMPLAPSVGLSIAAVSLGGKIGIGVTADPGLVPNVRHLAHAIEAAWRAFVNPQAGGPESLRAA